MSDIPPQDPNRSLLEYTEGIHAWNAWLTKTVSSRLPTPASRPRTGEDEPDPFDLAGVPADDDLSLAIALVEIAYHAGHALEQLADAARDRGSSGRETQAAIGNLGFGIGSQAFIGDALLRRIHTP